MTVKKYYSIGVHKKDFDIFVKIHENRKQDTTRADTFAFLMQFRTSMQEFKPHPRHNTLEQVSTKITENKP
jgi:hypothetical protein